MNGTTVSYAPKTPGLAPSKTGVKPRHKGKKKAFGANKSGPNSHTAPTGAPKKAHRKGTRRPDESSPATAERRTFDDRKPRSFDRSPNRDERGGYQRREDSGSYQRREDRPARTFNNDRPARSYDDRPARTFNDRPARSFDRPNRDRSENKYEEGIDELTPIAGKAAVEVGENNGFTAMGLPDKLVAALAASGISAPFAIQGEAIPTALTGADLLARAATGSGKTLAFGLPLIATLADVKREPNRPHAMVLVPTRELAMQVVEALAPLGKSLGLRMVLIAGGMPYKKQLMALESGVDVLISTPGRLIDLIERGAADLSDVRISVLDEADQMCDMGFLPEVTRILDETPEHSQRMLFSATLDGDVDKLVRKFLTDPVRHSTADVTASIDSMEHHVFVVHPGRKAEVTAELASREGRTIIFVRTKLGADRVAEKLREAGVGAAALHGGLNQGARTRTLSAFRDGHVPVLVATDVAARGIHIDDVELVVQADPPTDHKTYLHRAGRTARAGGSGSVVTLAMPRERGGVERTTRQAGLKVRGVYVEPGDAPLESITGGTKPSGVPVEEYRAPAPVRNRRPRRDSMGGDFKGGRGRSYGRRPQRSF